MGDRRVGIDEIDPGIAVAGAAGDGVAVDGHAGGGLVHQDARRDIDRWIAVVDAVDGVVGDRAAGAEADLDAVLTDNRGVAAAGDDVVMGVGGEAGAVEQHSGLLEVGHGGVADLDGMGTAVGDEADDGVAVLDAVEGAG